MHKSIMRGVVATDSGGANSLGMRSTDESTLTRTTVAPALWICAALAAAFHTALAGTVLPNTPAGTALRSWLVAFNSGDRAGIEAFDQAHAP